MNNRTRIPERVTEAYTSYIELGPRRSLRKLVSALAKHGVTVSLPTLKRWSSRYGWQAQIMEHERNLFEKFRSGRHEQTERTTKNALAAIEAAKEGFYARVLIDPDDPTLTRAEQRRALRPTVRDYIRILKVERDMFAEIDRARSQPSSPSPSAYTDREVKVMVAALARERRGLPQP